MYEMGGDALVVVAKEERKPSTIIHLEIDISHAPVNHRLQHFKIVANLADSPLLIAKAYADFIHTQSLQCSCRWTESQGTGVFT